MKPIHKVITLNQIFDLLEERRSKIRNTYDITKQHFLIQDTVYYIDNHGYILKARVTEIADFSHGGTIPCGCIYYWIEPDGCRLSWINKVHFWITWILPYCVLYHVPKRWRYKIPPCFPGHAVTAGEDIFRSEEEAMQALLLNNAWYDLQTLVDCGILRHTQKTDNDSLIVSEE